MSGYDTLLGQTRRRARLLIAPERLLTVVTRHHERFYVPALAGAAACSIVAQPENRGTAPAVLYTLARASALSRRRIPSWCSRLGAGKA